MVKFRYSWPFREPVSVDEAEDYLDIISNPMDFQTMQRKFTEGQYRHSSDFLEDMKLVFSNAEEYNQPGSAVLGYMTKTEQNFQELLQRLAPGLSYLRRRARKWAEPEHRPQNGKQKRTAKQEEEEDDDDDEEEEEEEGGRRQSARGRRQKYEESEEEQEEEEESRTRRTSRRAAASSAHRGYREQESDSEREEADSRRARRRGGRRGAGDGENSDDDDRAGQRHSKRQKHSL
ncbi:hypothetical protein SKAU_G00327640 [Synaphobranchus kaupii]|uniref:Bromo domain-containing protein n=1 Tax=Synaphobranchus kaupii TaxID=118154 RepID=A0A9Q1EPX3_SYNKA|nr:hypothetical protein SKAU_G00327640 [Synaphobranchus kaupii]